ncbi:unnamed protein product [Chilo suppressalis]|uniref:Dendritic cell-specific transmembrane protein-like domain-containing protein n=1 Tax=Chilo suppressalis TaxID=168631 RepID=A0ABN8L6L6_CHISP|nr:unnamed protein product [Chilo suppressalis]
MTRLSEWVRYTSSISGNFTPRSTPRNKRCRFKWLVPFIGGFALGQVYYQYMLKKIPLPGNLGFYLALSISLILAIGNVMCVQLQCICLLSILMYCGKPGRGVLKVVVLTYVIAGPITNMGLNAKEVVRVYACSTQLSQNLSGAKFEVMGEPFTTAVLGLRPDISQIKDTIKSIRDVILPIEIEIEDYKERRRSSYEISSQQYRKTPKVSDEELLQKLYLMKLERRCEDLVERAVAFCANLFTSTYRQCLDEVGTASSWVLCRPLKLCHICDLKDLMGYNICDATNQTNPGLGKGYIALKKAKNIVTSNREVLLQYKIETIHQLYNVQDAKETGDRVMHAFEEKYIVMHSVITAVNLCVALLFLRIFTAAVAYHDQYLTNIEYDNVYITGRFKKIDRKRRRRNQFALLPLKKMERSRYVDVHSLGYKSSERDNLVTHILKVLLEVVTATTFVMLDRLFYEALDVVRQHAEMELPTAGTRDLEIEKSDSSGACPLSFWREPVEFTYKVPSAVGLAASVPGG